MKIYIIQKSKYRIYKSEQIVQWIFGKTLIHDENGAPFLVENDVFSEHLVDSNALWISISDTKNYWACAVSSAKGSGGLSIGLDIEELSRPVKASTVKRLAKEEQDYLSPLDPQSREWKEEFLSIWVRKEAYSKRFGEGLRMGFSSFFVAKNPSFEDLGHAKDATDESLSFQYKRLFVGISPAEDYEIELVDYDAPFEISCMDAAAYMLDSKAYSAKMLKEKLEDRGYKVEDIELSIEKLEEYGYLNDESLAKSLARHFFEAGKAPRRIELELIKKGIPKEVAKKAAFEFEDDIKEKAMEIAAKMSPKNEKEKAKLARKLASLGYPQGVIYDILKRLEL